MHRLYSLNFIRIRKRKTVGFLEGEVVIVTEDDGPEVDQDIFGELPPSTVFIIKDKDLIGGI